MADRDFSRQALARRPAGSMGRPSGFGGWGMNPWRELEQMRRNMDDLMSGFFGRGFTFPQPAWTGFAEDEQEPDVDVFENDGEFTIYAALPGVKPEDIRVNATDDSIQISAEFKSPVADQTGDGQPSAESKGAESQTVRQHRQSRYSRQGSFSFAYTFPQEIRAEEARADFNHGRLELHLPKIQQDANAGKARQIPINSQGSQELRGNQGADAARRELTEKGQPAGSTQPSQLRTETATQPAPPAKGQPAAEKAPEAKKKAA